MTSVNLLASRLAKSGSDPQFLTLQETASRLRVSVRTVEREIADGKLSAVRVRRRIRISLDALSAYIAVATPKCQSANDTTVGKSAFRLIDDALKKHFRPVPPVPTRSRSKLLCAARKSTES